MKVNSLLTTIKKSGEEIAELHRRVDKLKQRAAKAHQSKSPRPKLLLPKGSSKETHTQQERQLQEKKTEYNLGFAFENFSNIERDWRLHFHLSYKKGID